MTVGGMGFIPERLLMMMMMITKEIKWPAGGMLFGVSGLLLLLLLLNK